MNRRAFLNNSLIGSAGLLTISALGSFTNLTGENQLPAILGGPKAHVGVWPNWPVWRSPAYDESVLEVLRSGVWSRKNVTNEFERQWAAIIGTKRCLSVVNGTNALVASLAQFNIGPGDEVLVPPYTFVATIQAVLLNGAMPVFVDIDPETFQIDPAKIEEKIGSHTKAILPVHILGIPADMTSIMRIAKRHDLIVIEDACQAHLAEVSGKRVGSIGHAGCFSFQTSKNMPIGEGGAIVSDDELFMDRCYSYHNLGFPFGTQVGSVSGGAMMIGSKIRFTEYQAAIGLTLMKNLQEETNRRWQHGQYLSKRLAAIPGIAPCKLYPETTKAVYHLFPFLYKKHEFKGMSRAHFIQAMKAEGIPCSSGYSPLNTQPFIESAFNSKLFQRIYDSNALDYEAYLHKNECPNNERICHEEAIWITQNLLLGDQKSMDNIMHAIEKIHANAEKINKKLKK